MATNGEIIERLATEKTLLRIEIEKLQATISELKTENRELKAKLGEKRD